jgi:hypothetical protein
LGQSKIDEVEWRSEAMGDGFSEAWKADWVECAGRVAMSKLEILSMKEQKHLFYKGSFRRGSIMVCDQSTEAKLKYC